MSTQPSPPEVPKSSWQLLKPEERADAMQELYERRAEYVRRTTSSHTRMQFLSAIELALSAAYTTLLMQTPVHKGYVGAALATIIFALVATLWVARPSIQLMDALRRFWPIVIMRRPLSDDACARALANTAEDRFYRLGKKVDFIRTNVYRRYHALYTVTIITIISVLLASMGLLVSVR